MSDQKQSKTGNYPFTVDSEVTQEMPSVNRLLDRKNLKFSDSSTAVPGSTSTPAPPPPPDPRKRLPSGPPPAPRHLAQKPPSIALAEKTPTPEIQPASSRNRRTHTRLAHWDLELLRKEKEPFCSPLALLIDPNNGAESACFFCIDQTPSSEKHGALHLVAHAALASGERMRLWSGVRWDPASAPQAWDHLAKFGYAEIMPSKEPTLRQALGITPDRWMIFVQVGPSDACRGIALLISKTSLQSRVAAAIPVLTASETFTKGKKAA